MLDSLPNLSEHPTASLLSHRHSEKILTARRLALASGGETVSELAGVMV